MAFLKSEIDYSSLEIGFVLIKDSIIFTKYKFSSGERYRQASWT